MNDPKGFAEAIQKGYASGHYQQAHGKWLRRRGGEVVAVCPMCAALIAEGVDVSKKRNGANDTWFFNKIRDTFGITLENFSQMLSWNDGYGLDWREIVERIEDGYLG